MPFFFSVFSAHLNAIEVDLLGPMIISNSIPIQLTSLVAKYSSDLIENLRRGAILLCVFLCLSEVNAIEVD